MPRKGVDNEDELIRLEKQQARTQTMLRTVLQAKRAGGKDESLQGQARCWAWFTTA
jgi:hypothetical protein